MNNYFHTFNQAWLATLTSIVRNGSTVEVRGSETREILADNVSFDMENVTLTVPGRNLSHDFAFAEAWWILTGRNNLALIQDYAPSLKKFSDDGIRLSGAYGPKVIDQIPYIVETLANDPHSRQAVINIWRERPGPSKDIPCTLSVQFTIRDGRIHTFVNMRSNDAWLGMPYDVFTMTMLTCLVGIELYGRTGMTCHLGLMHHNAASRHLYAKDIHKAKAIIDAESKTEYDQVQIDLKQICFGMKNSNDFVHSIMARLKREERLHDFLLVKQHFPWMAYGIPNAGS